MGDIESVELVERWVFADLSSPKFSKDDQRRVLDGINELEDQLTVWNRSLPKCVSVLTGTGNQTIYRSRHGDLRCYYVRNGVTLYCIGIGKRKNTYDRDLDQIILRAENY